MAAFDPRYGWFTPYLTNASNAICQQKIRSAVRGIYSPQTDHCLFRSKNTVSPFHRLANGNAVGHAAVGVCKTIDRIIRWQWLWNRRLGIIRRHLPPFPPIQWEQANASQTDLRLGPFHLWVLKIVPPFCALSPNSIPHNSGSESTLSLRCCQVY